MKTMKLGRSDLTVPRIAVGCMRLAGLSLKEAEAFIQTALEMGANFFDHADIYNAGDCETLFAKAAALTPTTREKVILQSKCGIVPGKMYDFSAEYITRSVEGILSRLGTEYLDVLLLHRPDALMEPEEVAKAFDALHRAGKVRHFGVSNHNIGQIKLLKRAVEQPLLANQLRLSPVHAGLISAGMSVNMCGFEQTDENLLDYCRLHDITVQAWSPLQARERGEVFLGNSKYPELNRVLDALAKQHNAAPAAIVLAWLLRHPAGIQPVTGTANREHLSDCLKADEIALTRSEWYDIYRAAGNPLP